MKIALLIDTWFPFIGGGQINAYEISKRVAEGGIHIDIITRNNGVDGLKISKNLKVIKLGNFSHPQNTLARIIFQVYSTYFLLKNNYDIIHAHAFLPGISARIAAVIKGKPTVFTVHGTSLNSKLNNFLSRALEKFILTQIRYDIQISVSKDFLNLKNINQEVIYIPNGVNPEKFDKIRQSKNKVFTMIFVGRLHPQKNIIKLLETLNIIRTELDFQLFIVGNGPQKSQILNTIKKLGLRKIVKMFDEVHGKDLIKMYKSSHLFVLPSLYEGQPITLLESWAARVPVIASKTGDCQYLIKNGENGYLIKNPNNIADIASTVKKAISSNNLDELGQNGYNLVLKSFSWDKSATKTRKVYESLTNS